MNKKENKGYQTTHRQIMDTLIELLKGKDIKQVTVAEICRIVHINRSTFYEHFVDTYDVIEQIAAEISDEALELAPDVKPTKDYFMNLFCHIREYKDFYSLFFKQGLPPSVKNKLLPKELPPDVENIAALRHIVTDVQFMYHHAFFQAGLSAIITNWLDRNCAESPEELYDILKSEYQFQSPESEL